MELPILTSKKGTKVIKSTQLHRALGLNDAHYAKNIKHWLSDVYQFGGEIRKPAGMTDYARAKQIDSSLLKEYYLSLRLARLITLASRSKVKQAVANKLAREEEAYPQMVQLSADQMIELLEQSKAMTRISCQRAAEKRHAAAYARRRGGMDYWNHYRAEMIGIRKEEIIRQLDQRGIKYRKRSTLSELLLRLDACELIRIGLTDHYAAQGHPLSYAQDIGRIGKQLAAQMNLEVIDDRKGEQLFAAPVDAGVMAGIQGVAA
ncbi:hypothetical protein CEQ90_18850 [Lewinellaceae bacterium SD302]|nr:hypothetical protein CEQ90_18850 [Lewinellaceae bacterium SD302]